MKIVIEKIERVGLLFQDYLNVNRLSKIRMRVRGRWLRVLNYYFLGNV